MRKRMEAHMREWPNGRIGGKHYAYLACGHVVTELVEREHYYCPFCDGAPLDDINQARERMRKAYARRKPGEYWDEAHPELGKRPDFDFV